VAIDTSAAATIIVIKKRNKSHGAHHGGAWKVAYADFVTAMMALFIVLWLLSASQEVQKAIGGYFTDPTGRNREIGSAVAGSGEAITVKKDDMNQIKDKLQQAVKQMVQLKKAKDQIQMSVTGEGLRIELLETDKGMFFESGKAAPTVVGREILLKLAEELGKLPNRLLIEGHTDAKPFAGAEGYTNWELSADRANSARRLMESSGLRPGQVMQVRGFADQDLRNVKNPADAANRRISVIVRYSDDLLDTSKKTEAKAVPAKLEPASSKPSKPSHAGPIASR
jgi:chemotaxis protein MotB